MCPVDAGHTLIAVLLTADAARAAGHVSGEVLVIALVGWAIIRLGARVGVRKPFRVALALVTCGTILIALGVTATSRGAVNTVHPCARIGMTATQDLFVQSTARRTIPADVRRAATQDRYYFCA